MYVSKGGVGDLCASVLYVPSEVLKTRLQLQGKINTGYKYKSTLDAAQKIYSRNGFDHFWLISYFLFLSRFVGLYSGLGATLLRDVPFTALQFTFYGLAYMVSLLLIIFNRNNSKFLPAERK